MSGTARVDAREIEEKDQTEDLALMTPRQRLFCEALMASREFNMVEAAKRAGYADPKNSVGQLMKNPRVKRFIAHLTATRANPDKITAERVLTELGRIGLFNPKRMLDGQGVLMHLKDMPDEVAACIQEIKVTSVKRRPKPGEDLEDLPEQTLTEIKFWNKLTALEALAKHLGLLKETAVNLNVNLFEVLAGIIPQAKRATDVDEIEEKIRAIAGPEVSSL